MFATTDGANAVHANKASTTATATKRSEADMRGECSGSCPEAALRFLNGQLPAIGYMRSNAGMATSNPLSSSV